MLAVTCSLLLPVAFADSDVSLETDADLYEYGETVKISGETSTESVTIQIKDVSGKTILIRNINADGSFSFNFNLSNNLILGKYDIIVNAVIDGVPQISSTSINLVDDKQSSSLPVSSSTNQEMEQKDDVTDSEGGGCLIATAAFGSEMAPQVQFLREIRDNTVLQTESGTSFMTSFNQFYYLFSPAVADYERENQVFREVVKLTLTPLLTSLTLLNYVDIDTEQEMLGYGIGVILLNIGMYFVTPAVLLIGIAKRFR
jgi:hypothetical protein